MSAAPVAVGLLVVVAAARVVQPMGVRPASRRALELSAAVPSRVVEIPAWFRRRAVEADLHPVARWWWIAIGFVLAVGLLVARTGGGLGLLVGLGCGAVAVLVLLGAAGHRREAHLVRSVPEALDAVARSCRAGASVHQALHRLAGTDVGPAGPLLAEVAGKVDRGVALEQALSDLVAVHPVAPVRLAAVALLVGNDTGAAPARAVEGVAATLRDHAALEREAQALATQAKASVAVLVLAPIGFGALAVSSDPRVASFLFGEPIGILCLVIGLGLDALGAWWMHRLVRRPR